MNIENEDFSVAAETGDESEFDYKPFHPLTLVALGLAVCGLLSVAWFPLVVVCGLAALIAVVSIHKIGSPPKFSGLKLAQFALMLAVVGAAAASTYKFGRSWRMKQAAYRNSEVVLDLMTEGRWGEAFEYGTDPTKRQPEGTDLMEYYSQRQKNENSSLPPVVALNTWLSILPMKNIFEDEGKGKLTFLRFQEYPRDHPQWESIACDYRYTPAEESAETVEFRLVMLRRYFGHKGTHWRFRRFEPLVGASVEGQIEVTNEPRKSGDNKDPDPDADTAE